MFWETLWALVLDFTISGVVQAFVSKEKMQAKLGNHGPTATVRASAYGMASSSCSYAASAMSKSLFVKGADFTSAMVFMIASTNLVVELGVVMLILLEWQFMVAAFVGGPIMITIVALAGGIVFSGALVAGARQRLARPVHAEHAHTAMTGVSDDRQTELELTPWAQKLTSKAAWSDASSYAVADVKMLRKELVIGFVVAGFLGTLVSTHVWNALFLHGHGFWTDLENALIGPLIAVISWVCSIGNVPLAASLWSGGISFGGVIAFIFADLIAMPLILIYRKFYGPKLTARLVALFYVAMTTAGVLSEVIFRLFGAVPTSRSLSVTTAHFEWNYTTYLDFFFIAIAVVVWWLARHRLELGGGTGYGIDPVCAMQVRTADAPAMINYADTTFYFCSDRCAERFRANPECFMRSVNVADTSDMAHDESSSAVDPVCGVTVGGNSAVAKRTHGGTDLWFRGVGCAERFDANPAAFVTIETHDHHHES